MTVALSIATKGFWPSAPVTATVYHPLNGEVSTNSKTGTVVLS